MAKQHFYSSVPAKMSMFNKMDGYDTFAHSSGITREQIEKYFSPIYDIKTTKDDIALMKNGALPTVYCQYTTDNDDMVQGAVSFMQKDYTGERSSYMVHTLLLSDDEKNAYYNDYDACVLNNKVFKNDLSDFDLTSFESSPITDLKDLKVPLIKANPTSNLLEKYDAGMLKRLIYALFRVACGKAKSVYLSIKSPTEMFSNDCAEFLNCILQIFPYHMRKSLSFVTYINDASKYPSFKIKCMPEEIPAVPTTKGITIKMGIKDYAGINDANVAENAAVVDFFFGLLSADNIRKEFIDFCRNAVNQVPDLEKVSIKNVTDLVFLFRALSGFFEENTVVPNDDAVYSLITVYDKNRTALSEKYCGKALCCLKRYSATHTPIPKNVFSKICNIYPEENADSKAVVMQVVLELIHTDVMRDKLFGFIKANYELETAETKAEIMKNVCRVYYGGFLQSQILEFFTKYFATEPEDIRTIILERLLLTVRTPKIQDGVLGFIKEFFGVFNDNEKDKFYSVFYEMLPEGDALSRALCDIVDEHIDESRKEDVKNHVLSALEADEKRSEPKLCAVLISKCGFIESLVAQKVFTDWQNRKVVNTFIDAVCNKNLIDMAESICGIWNCTSDISEKIIDKLYSKIEEKFSSNTKYNIFDLVAFADKLSELKGAVNKSSEFVEKIQTELLSSKISEALPFVFDVKHYPGALQKITELSKDRTFISENEAFAAVKYYNEICSFINSDTPEYSLSTAEKIAEKNVRAGAAMQIKKDLPELYKSENAKLFANIVIGYLTNGMVNFVDADDVMRELLLKRPQEEIKTDGKEFSYAVDELSLSLTLKAGAKIYSSGISDELKSSIISNDGEIQRLVAAYLSKYDKKGKKSVNTVIEQSDFPSEYKQAVIDALNVKSSGGLFAKLFKKK